jgi:acyl-CoA thioesterase
LRFLPATAMPNSVDALLSILDLEPLGDNRFLGISPQDGWRRVFGGQVIAQALVAAARIRCTPTSSCPATRPSRSSMPSN